MINNSKSIVFLGNMNNMAFYFARKVKERGVKVKLFVDQKKEYTLDRPEYFDTKIKDEYPDWIHELDSLGSINFYKLIFPLLFFKNLINELNKYDIIVLNGIWVVLANYLNESKVKIGFFAGYDLDVLADKNKVNYLVDLKIRRWNFLSLFSFFLIFFYKQKISQQINGIRNLDYINYYPSGINPTGDAIIATIKNGQNFKRLELRGMETGEFPLIIDRKPNLIFKILNFTRFYFTDATRNDNKRNDIMIKGIARFICDNNIQKRDILIEFYEKGEDVDAAKDLINSLNISDYINWKKMVPQNILNEDIKSADVVFDQFGNQWLGYGIVALFYGIPVIANGRLEIFEPIAGRKLNICNSFDEIDVCNWLTKLYFNRNLGVEIGRICSEEYKELYKIDATVDFVLNASKINN